MIKNPGADLLTVPYITSKKNVPKLVRPAEFNLIGLLIFKRVLIIKYFKLYGILVKRVISF